jgi:hypothetical protein
VEEEFTRLLPKDWRWTARHVADNMFTARFPNAHSIKEWEVEHAWFRVKGIPYDKISVPTLAYVGSLVGATREVDHNSLHRANNVRIKISTKDVSKVHEVVEGAILLYLYDFYFEREVEWGSPNNAQTVKGGSRKEEVVQPSPKKSRTDGNEVGQSSMQIEVYSSKVSGNESRAMKQMVKELPRISESPLSPNQVYTKGFHLLPLNYSSLPWISFQRLMIRTSGIRLRRKLPWMMSCWKELRIGFRGFLDVILTLPRMT